ncbi:MAG: hypothetical protein NAG76_08575 [Candidatus Pristimantibacillus lignocellulolyticus]|uniref:Uncharacterized protein n=1 Tax=Candidatus Pristimantibacillus lignocellulolyticus TaxID=2994561 RepID=A0A9J6ZJ46_9BACL|nr:MAG: hypothetical protein NAG76_08575 [Candidatus Pristimantibacillus lignocellulolyticus]
MKKIIIIGSGFFILLLLFVSAVFLIGQLSLDSSSIYKRIHSSIFERVDVEKLYEETPYIFEAGKELIMHDSVSSHEELITLDEFYTDTPFIQEANEGDGGIIKNRYVTVFPYDFQINLSSYNYTSELKIVAKENIRVAVLGEIESDSGDTESYFDVNLLIDDISYGIYRFKTGVWGYSDWTNIPEGMLKLELYNPDEKGNSRIIGFGAIFTGD